MRKEYLSDFKLLKVFYHRKMCKLQNLRFEDEDNNDLNRPKSYIEQLFL
jgi:hypothetical protein